MALSIRSVTLGLTASLALLSALLNGALLRALLKSRPRQRTSGMLGLSCLEVALSLLLAGAMLCHAWKMYGAADATSMLLLNSAHALQMARNHWLVVLGAIRLAALIRPRGSTAAAASTGRLRFGRVRQLALLAGLCAISAVTLFAVAVGFETELDAESTPSDVAIGNASKQAVGLPEGILGDEAFNLTEFQRGARNMLLKYSAFSAAGVLLPGLAVTGITAKTVHILWAGRQLHPATRRTTKAVALLCAAFVVCQFPLAATYSASAAYLLSLTSASAAHLLAVVHVLESVSSWSLVLVPADSCLTFLILARYSRHFRALLLGHRCCRCCQQLQSSVDENLDEEAAADRDAERQRRHQQRRRRRRQLRQGQGRAGNAEGAESLAMFQLTSANQVTAGVTSQPEEEEEGDDFERETVN